MNKNYMIYPMKNMRITCRYDEGSHRSHNINVSDNNIDYPIDDAGIDSGRDSIYCPCDSMKVVAIRGIGNPSITNTIWLVSTNEVITPGFVDKVYMTLTHSDDSDIKDLYVGKEFKRGEIICKEGSNGTNANHIHITVGRGYCDTWIENSNHKWIIKGDSKKPEEVFFIDKEFTKVIDNRNINFEYLEEEKIDIIGNPVERDIYKDQVEVLIDNLNLRESYSVNSKKIGYIRKGMYDIKEIRENEGYTWYKVENYYIASNIGWTKFYKKEKYPRLIFTCTSSGKYIIYLKEGSKLYIS